MIISFVLSNIIINIKSHSENQMTVVIISVLNPPGVVGGDVRSEGSQLCAASFSSLTYVTSRHQQPSAISSDILEIILKN